ncbi:hypothetical protein MFIFM68171_05882 [Madurella fahalii]|uniref:Uncharacterized protein n=1 Tax=Madurella fahalii TaxID=1157608 RepID=A0ABQ0GD66_9PEZI
MVQTRTCSSGRTLSVPSRNGPHGDEQSTRTIIENAIGPRGRLDAETNPVGVLLRLVESEEECVVGQPWASSRNTSDRLGETLCHGVRRMKSDVPGEGPAIADRESEVRVVAERRRRGKAGDLVHRAMNRGDPELFVSLRCNVSPSVGLPRRSSATEVPSCGFYALRYGDRRRLRMA